jgi:hypothetical protein
MISEIRAVRPFMPTKKLVYRLNYRSRRFFKEIKDNGPVARLIYRPTLKGMA